MHENAIFSKREISFLKELTRNHVEFMIVGLSAAALQGAPVVTQDVDLWFKDLNDPGIRKALKKVDGVFVSSISQNPPMFAGDSVKLFDIVVHMHGLNSFKEEAKSAEKMKLAGVLILVLPLARIIKSKQALGRPKDKMVMRVLKDAIRAKDEKKTNDR